MHVGMLGTMAQIFLGDLREKTKRGQLGRVLQGKSAAGKAFGYDVVEGNRARQPYDQPGRGQDRRADLYDVREWGEPTGNRPPPE